MVHIAISGSARELSEFVKVRNVEVLDKRDFEGIDKILLEGYISKSELNNIVKANDEIFTSNILTNLAIYPSKEITKEESREIALHLAMMTEKGIDEIIRKNLGVKKAECR